ncbi:MAG: Leucyl-tRNA ligase LeuS, partial [Candidatus Nomurabacteria bacterium GW2011_GWE2_36_115]
TEPYMKRTSHGMILASGGVKMSKSIGNTIDPKDIVDSYGADTLRIYEMFIGPFDQAVSWNTDSIIGSRRFLDKIWRLGERIGSSRPCLGPIGGKASSRQLESASLQTLLHKTIKKIGEDIESMSFNTAISSMMILVNEMEKEEFVNEKDFKMFLQILAPFAPHITEEIWSTLGEKKSIHKSSWPKWDKKKIVDDTVKIAVQVNGKVRSEIMVSSDADEEAVKNLAIQDKNIIPWIEGKPIRRVIYVKGRIVNIVV